VLTAAPRFSAWLDEFFASYYRHRPVNATFIGEHGYDHLMPDFSEAGVEAIVADMTTLLHRLGSLPPEPLTPTESLDRTLAEGFLRIQLWEYASDHFQRGNPALYTGEAIFAILSLFLTEYAPIQEQTAAAIERMAAIPGVLAQCKANVQRAPQAWTDRAIHECEGALALFGHGIDLLMGDNQIEGDRMRAAADKVVAAFADLRDHLQHELLPNPVERYACGAEAFDLLMRQGHCLDLTGDQIVAYAEEVLAEADAELEAHAKDFGASTVADALSQLADTHPSAEKYNQRYTELWQQCRELAVNRRLLAWPDFPIQYVPRPLWTRQAAPYLYFLFYRSPAAFNRPPVHHYLIAPLEEGLTSVQQDAFLRSHNDSVIKLNHVVHHGAIGHHVQNWHAYRAASRIGRIAAVDCASRIAMFCAGTMAEGWACYATNLMGEVGFFTPLESYSEHQSRRRMAARAIVDVKLHRSEFSLGQAAEFYAQRAAMAPAAARNEAVKNSMFPGAAMMYLIGTDTIHDLRRKLEARMGSNFDLADFHDRFLAYGSVPVSLIAAEMQRAWDEGERRTSHEWHEFP
jgi:uncharacterized protein (DUF885 family)